MNASMNADYEPALQAGDVLWYQKNGFPPVRHYALVVRQNMVLENIPGAGERLIWLNAFLEGREVFIEQRAGWNPQFEARLQAILRNPKKYDLLTRNCQGTVNEIILGRAISPQVGAAAGIAALIGLGFLLIGASKAA